MECDAHAGILRWWFEAADFFLMLRIGEIENDEAVAAEGAVAAVPAVFEFFGHVDGTVQPGEGSLVRDDFRRNQLRPDPLVVFGFFAFAGAGNPPHGNFLGAGRVGSVDDHVAVDQLAEIGRLVNEGFVWGRVEVGVLAAVVIVAMRALASGAGAEFGEFHDFGWVGGIVKPHAAKAFEIFALVVEMRIIVLTHGSFRRGVGDGGLRAGHEDPLLEVFVVGDLDLVAFETAFVEHHRLADVADVDDISLLKDVAAIACGHHLHLAVARLSWPEVGENFHVADVHAAVEVSDAVRAGMAVVVGKSGER